ncbi:MAG: hypothetical protein WC022_01090 [Parcubacteria group bacterium]
MKITKKIKANYEKWLRRKTIKILTQTEPSRIVKYGEDMVVPAFLRAARHLPAYAKFLQDKKVDLEKVKDLETFKKFVPIVCKTDIFPQNELKDYCLDASTEEVKSVMTSSGFSGVFSFGLNTEENLKKAERSIDTALDYAFDISNRKTFLMNCLPMGVRVPTSLKYADTSVRLDMALAIFKKIIPEFDQVIFISDPHVIKNLLEEGIEQGIDWKKHCVHIIMGEDWISESMRGYLCHLLGSENMKREEGLVAITFGSAELELNLFHESVQSIMIRQAAQKDKKLRYALFGEGVEVCPNIFHYYPHRSYIETVSEPGGKPELVFSMLSPTLLTPLMRYNIKDNGSLMSYDELKKILEDNGYVHLAPELKLPLVILGGRNEKTLRIGNFSASPEEIKQGIYENFELAGATTGYFRLSVGDDKFKIEIQLRKNITPDDALKNKFSEAIEKYIKGPKNICLYSYEEFPYSMELDYERKFKNV